MALSPGLSEMFLRPKGLRVSTLETLKLNDSP
jgi:hypothetical protein